MCAKSILTLYVKNINVKYLYIYFFRSLDAFPVLKTIELNTLHPILSSFGPEI